MRGVFNYARIDVAVFPSMELILTLLRCAGLLALIAASLGGFVVSVVWGFLLLVGEQPGLRTSNTTAP